jgi:hypothetical protein
MGYRFDVGNTDQNDLFCPFVCNGLRHRETGVSCRIWPCIIIIIVTVYLVVLVVLLGEVGRAGFFLRVTCCFWY